MNDRRGALEGGAKLVPLALVGAIACTGATVDDPNGSDVPNELADASVPLDGDIAQDAATHDASTREPDGGYPYKPGTVAQSPEDCTGAQPSWIGGYIRGSDDRAINAIVGLDFQNASKVRVDPSGKACGTSGVKCCAGYSACVRTNPSIDPEGLPPSADRPELETRWGVCVSSLVKDVFIEIYPKNQEGITTHVRYGSAMHHYQPIPAGAETTVNLRLPMTFEADGGNTGSVHGYVTCNGKAVAPEDITRVRAWSESKGPTCGIEGFSASADQKAKSKSMDATFYSLDYLAGGQCGAPDQLYRLYMDVTCGGGKKTMKKFARVAKGTKPRVDWNF
ncbi:MAG: hypothetical protein KC416_05070 [Myxococcales bacterium]|nr:hypothetical protein [Myxococcales bacterium]